MGLLDNVLGSAVPGGNLAKPLMIGLAALLGARAVRKRPRRSPRGDWSRRADPANRTADPTSRTRSAAGRSSGRPQRHAAELSAKRA